MGLFNNWLEKKINEAGMMPNMGQQAIPMGQYPAAGQQNSAPQAKPQQVSLSQFAGKIKDPTWHHLYDSFTTSYQKHPNDPKTGQLGTALYQAAQSGNMQGLQPFRSQYGLAGVKMGQ